ncbi:MAG: hypothetical protein WCR36_03415 [Bacteroidaceae bacterium]
MITDEMIKTEFIADTLNKGIRKIYRIQEETVDRYLHKKSGDLSSFLSRSPFHYSSSAGSVTYYARILSYLRFLDMHYRKGNDRISKHIRSNLALYNRVVWGVLYGDTFPDIEFGLLDSIKSGIREQLKNALNSKS